MSSQKNENHVVKLNQDIPELEAVEPLSGTQNNQVHLIFYLLLIRITHLQMKIYQTSFLRIYLHKWIQELIQRDWLDF